MLRVCLYLTIPNADENQPVASTASKELKRFAHRCADLCKWMILRKFSVTFWAWQALSRSNKGDSIIRESIRQQIADTFGQSEVDFLELRWGSLSEDVVATLNASCDLFVIAGGGYLF